jgi:hypothetical protein
LVGGLAGIATDVPILTKPCAAILDSPYPDTSLGGTTNPHCPPWWHPASPLRALLAPRIPFTARIGVGAVQNRRRDHRVVPTVCGDAGRPAHQRPATPPCARRRDASIPTRLRPHDASLPIHRVAHPQTADAAMWRLAQLCLLRVREDRPTAAGAPPLSCKPLGRLRAVPTDHHPRCYSPCRRLRSNATSTIMSSWPPTMRRLPNSTKISRGSTP